MLKFSFVALATLALAACGGDSSSADDYQSLADQAAAAKAQAISLGVPSPCSQVQQCGTLAFQDVSGHCLSASYHPYSLVSPTAAAASAAAADEVALATQAFDVAPPSACTGAIIARPTLACVANACQAAQ